MQTRSKKWGKPKGYAGALENYVLLANGKKGNKLKHDEVKETKGAEEPKVLKNQNQHIHFMQQTHIILLLRI